MADEFSQWFARGLSKKIDDGQVVFRRGDSARRAYLLKSGAVEILHADENGQALVVKILAAPNLFGIIEQLGNEPSYLETVRTLGPTEVVSLEREAFVTLVRSSNEACFAFLKNMSTAFCLAARFEPAHLATTEQKLANYLCALFELYGEAEGDCVRLGLKRGQDDFAEAIGVSARNTHRLLIRLQETGVLRKQGGRYELLNAPTLSALAGDLLGSLVLR